MISIDWGKKAIVPCVNGLTQWDYGQTLALRHDYFSLDDGTEVQFYQGELSHLAYIEDGICAIPDRMLQNAGKIMLYVYVRGTDSGETVLAAVLNIKARPRPENYVLPAYEEYRRLLPAGGEAGQVLTKKSDKNYDTEWATLEQAASDGTEFLTQEKADTLYVRIGSTVGSGGSNMTFGTVAELQSGWKDAGMTYGSEFKTNGYYADGDGGGANYITKYLYSAGAYPWAIDMGETDDTEYQLTYEADGTPVLDENGDYVLAKDSDGNPIPLYNSDGTVKKKHMYAVITDTVVNYRQFGAKLDGETDDYTAIYNAHKYQHDTYTTEPLSGRKRYYIKVENHEGIIRKDNDEPISCAGDIDLSGSQILLQDCNSTWFGFYLWGDNEEDYLSYEPTSDCTDTYLRDNFVITGEGDLKPNSLLWLKEDTYAVRDDAGYLYTEPRYELLLHTLDGVLANPFTYDWAAMGGQEIRATVTDTNQSSGYRTETVNTSVQVSYTRLPATHYHFVGCDVKIEMGANKYPTVLWCKCHNAHIRGFNIQPDTDNMHNTSFKDAMIYVWGCYNVEVSDIVGFNAAGKASDAEGTDPATSGYVLRVTNSLNVHIHDVSVQGYWGATAMNCVKDIHMERVNINRIDVHNYFYNLFIDKCNLYNHSIQIGEGRGILQVTNCNFYINQLDYDSYANAHMLEFNLTYGRIFEGQVLIQNCNAYIKGASGNEYDVCKMDFSPDAVSSLCSYKFPEVTIKDCYLYSYDADTYLVYFMVAGSRKCKTSTSGPDAVIGYCNDTGNDGTGTLAWKCIGRGVDWSANTDTSSLDVVAGQYVRTYSSFVNSDGTTSFYDFRYFRVTEGGTLPTPTDDNKPSDYTGDPFTAGTATLVYVSRERWESNRDYAVGDCCFVDLSNWFPVYCFECTSAGRSNGWRPTATTDDVIIECDTGDAAALLDACNWQYEGTLESFVDAEFTSELEVTEGQILLADHRLYKVTGGGTLREIPPLNQAWLGSFTEGTATLSFIGMDWKQKQWFAKGSYCISYNEDGVACVYQEVNQAGITNGSIPVNSNGRVVDGDMVWEYTTDAATAGEWTELTQYFVGDVVSNGDNNYKCIFDGRLELPRRITLDNIASNMSAGDVFAFYEADTDIPTKLADGAEEWRINIRDVEVYRNKIWSTYFLHSGNPDPVINGEDLNVLYLDFEPDVQANSISIGLASGETVTVSVIGYGEITDNGTECTVSSYTTLELSSKVSKVKISNKRALTELKFGGTTAFGDISCLANLESLEYLNFYSTSITGDIADLANSTSLASVTAYDTVVTGDISALADSLYYYSGAYGSSFSWIKGRKASANIISIGGNPDFGSYLDAMLINQAECTASDLDTNKKIQVRGDRTTSSDEAVETLKTKGYTVTVNYTEL